MDSDKTILAAFGIGVGISFPVYAGGGPVWLSILLLLAGIIGGFLYYGYSPRERESRPHPAPKKAVSPYDDRDSIKAGEGQNSSNTKISAPSFKLVSITYAGQNVTSLLNLVEIQALGSHIHAALQGEKREDVDAPKATLQVIGSFDYSAPQEFTLSEQRLFTSHQGAWVSYELPKHIASLWRLRFS